MSVIYQPSLNVGGAAAAAGGGQAFKVMSVQPVAADSATIIFAPGASTPAESFERINFDNVTTQYVDFKCKARPAYAGGDMEIDLRWGPEVSAIVGSVVFEAAVRRIEDTDNLKTSSHAYSFVAAATATAPGTHGLTDSLVLTIPAASLDGIVAGDTFWLRLRRNTAPPDDMADKASLQEISLEEAA